MKDNRQHPRKSVTDACYLIDTDRDLPIGRVTNLSLGGMLVRCDQPIEDLTFFDCKLVLPREGDEPAVITFGARSMWCEKDTVLETWEVGFKFLGLTRNDKWLIAEYLATWQVTAPNCNS